MTHAIILTTWLPLIDVDDSPLFARNVFIGFKTPNGEASWDTFKSSCHRFVARLWVCTFCYRRALNTEHMHRFDRRTAQPRTSTNRKNFVKRMNMIHVSKRDALPRLALVFCIGPFQIVQPVIVPDAVFVLHRRLSWWLRYPKSFKDVISYWLDAAVKFDWLAVSIILGRGKMLSAAYRTAAPHVGYVTVGLCNAHPLFSRKIRLFFETGIVCLPALNSVHDLRQSSIIHAHFIGCSSQTRILCPRVVTTHADFNRALQWIVIGMKTPLVFALKWPIGPPQVAAVVVPGLVRKDVVNRIAINPSFQIRIVECDVDDGMNLEMPYAFDANGSAIIAPDLRKIPDAVSILNAPTA